MGITTFSFISRFLLGFALSLTALCVRAQTPTEMDSSFKWKADIRVRGQVENTEAADSRKSGRLRARLGFRKDVSETLGTEFRLATTTNYRSTNQVLGDSADPGFTRRYMGLDLAYADWKPAGYFRLNAGRIPQWHQRPGGTQIILDEDIALEGFSVRGEAPISESWKIWWGVGSALIRENYDALVYSEDHTDNFLHTGDVAFINDDWKFKFGASFFNFVGVQGRLFSELAAGGAALGNSQLPVGTVKNNYRPVRAYVDQSFEGLSGEFNLFAEHIINDDTRDPNKAWWLGTGYTRKPWTAQIAYGELLSDVTPAVFTFSDFAAGQTDARGFMWSLQYQINKNFNFKYTGFANRQQFSERNRQYVRTHLDLSTSF